MGITRTALPQRGLAQKQGTGSPQARDGKRITLRLEVLEQHRAHGGGHAQHIALILDQHRNAMHRAAQLAAALQCFIAGTGLGEYFRIDGDDGVDLRAGPVQRFNPIQIPLHQLHCSEGVIPIATMNFGDGDFVQRVKLHGHFRSGCNGTGLPGA